jgi:hypothetical protein
MHEKGKENGLPPGYPGKIDRNMRVLVSILVRYLGLRTYASCGGHTKLSGRENPVGKGEFYVSFVNIPQDSPETFKRSLSIIKAAIQEYDGKIILENDSETDPETFPS